MKLRFYRNINSIETIVVGDNDVVMDDLHDLHPSSATRCPYGCGARGSQVLR